MSPRTEGKSVWFRLLSSEQPSAELPSPPPGDGHPSALPGTVTVELRNVPLLVHARWQQQAEALLREHLLDMLTDDERAIAQLEQHAECSDAVALLAEAVAASAQRWQPNDAGDEVWCHRVVMSVPHESVGHFSTLDRIMAAALTEADAEQLLSAPTDPEARRFRKWVCEQVADQARGLPPNSWRPG